MKQAIYTKIITICLLLLAILPLGSAFNLTWKELVRLFVITLGLLYLYVRYFRRAKPQPQGVEGKGNLEPRTSNLEPNKPRTSHFALRTSHFEPLLLSIVYIFLITQFDPATSAIKDIIPQSRLNWFFIASSALIFVAFGAFLLQQFGVGRKGNLEPRTLNLEPNKPPTPNLEPGGELGGGVKPRTSNLQQKVSFSFLDKFVLAAGVVLVLAVSLFDLLLTTHRQLAVLGGMKIFEYVILYFLVTRTFYSIGELQVTDSKSPAWFRRIANNRLRLASLLILFVFSVIILIGGYRVSSAFYHFEKGKDYCFNQKYGLSLSQFKEANELGGTLDLEYFSGEKFSIARFGYYDYDDEPTRNRLGMWEERGGVALDYHNRSVGVDLGKESLILKIGLYGTRVKTRIRKQHLGIYFSDDNNSYRKYEGDWRFRNVGTTILIEGLIIKARFIKVNCSFADSNYEFGARLRDMIRVYGL